MHWWNGDGHMDWMGMGWMGMGWIVVAALIAVVFWAVLRSSRGRMNGSIESPRQVLESRYAKGEIDQTTYRRMLTEIKG